MDKGTLDLTNCVLLLLGRIGYATVKRLAQEGAKVVLSSRKEENVKKAVAELKAEGLDVFGMVCHVGKQDQVQRLLQEVGD